jgi:hypothetical protein
MFSSLCWSNLLRGYLDLCPHCPRWKSQGLCAPLKVGWIFATDDVDDSWRWFMIVHRKLQPWFPENVLNISEPQIKACDIISNQGTRIQWIGFVGKIFTGNHVFFYFRHQISGFPVHCKADVPIVQFQWFHITQTFSEMFATTGVTICCSEKECCRAAGGLIVGKYHLQSVAFFRVILW